MEMSNFYKKSFKTINCRGKLMEFSIPKIMGILNLTPDSFSDGGLFNNEKSALYQVEKMLNEGADIIDIGAQSTRPNADFISSKEEILRIGKTISNIKKEFPECLVSLDTFWAETVLFGYNEGIDIVNDISAGQFDENLLPTVAYTQLPYVLMHINQTYEAMHNKQEYADIVLSINEFLFRKIEILQKTGIKDIIIDPGFGFGKSIENQYTVINEIQYLGLGKYPTLIGISRKSFIYKPLQKSPLEVNKETQELHLKVLKQGANILRVHDVAETKNTIELFLQE